MIADLLMTGMFLIMSSVASLHFYSIKSFYKEFQTHKKQAKGILSHMSDSIYNMGASYMMKNRPLEFSLMQEYVTVFGEKLATLGRIVGRVVREQSGWFMLS